MSIQDQLKIKRHKWTKKVLTENVAYKQLIAQYYSQKQLVDRRSLYLFELYFLFWTLSSFTQLKSKNFSH